MYITTYSGNENPENFDWSKYFVQPSPDEVLKTMDLENLVKNLRKHLQEDTSRMVFILGKMMLKLMEGFDFKNPEILELGAATGLLTKWLLSQYEGKAVLVDKCETSYQAFSSRIGYLGKSVTYLIEDVFTLELEKSFDIVCSFGLVEHFPDKKPIIAVHKKFVNQSGIIIVLVPLDSPLSRAYFEVYPELNLGYRELLTVPDIEDVLKQSNLEILRTQISTGYVYDFIGVLCREK